MAYELTSDQMLAELDRRGYGWIEPPAGMPYEPVREWAAGRQDTDHAKYSFAIGEESGAGLMVRIHAVMGGGARTFDDIVRMVKQVPDWYLRVPEARQAAEDAGAHGTDRALYEALCSRFGVPALADDALRTRAQSRLDAGASNELTLVLDCARVRALAPQWEKERVAAEVAAHGHATPDQVNEIMRLLRQRGGDPMALGGWMSGPTGRADVRRMSSLDAQRYIDSMNGDY